MKKNVKSDIRASFPRSWRSNFLKAQGRLDVSSYSGVAQHAVQFLWERHGIGVELPEGATPVPSGSVYLRGRMLVVMAEPAEVWPSGEGGERRVVGAVDIGQAAVDAEGRIQAATDLVGQYGSTGEAHHDRWMIDQTLRLLLSDPDYSDFVAKFEREGESWDVGVAP